MKSKASDKTLYYFTQSYPYGTSSQWKRSELEVLRKYFKRVIVVPLSYGGNREARNLVEGVEYRSPIIDAEHSRTDRRGLEKLRNMFSSLRPPMLRHFITELLRPTVLFSRERLKELLRTTYEIALFRKNPAVAKLLDGADTENSIFYFYWGIGQVNTLLFKRKDQLPFTACRFHGWDLYEERHRTKYIPYRRWLVDTIDLLLPCSNDGASYLAEKGADSERIFVARLGTSSVGRSQRMNEGVLNIVSCSFMTPVKRLDLLCEALTRSTIPISWTHIGDGELMPTIRQYVEKFPSNVEGNLVGAMPSSEVASSLANGTFDLFINTSSSEGVPVSIMESFAAGIPVYATDVGGTGEIVDDSVGKLVSASVSASELAALIEEFSRHDGATIANMREAAFRRYQESCDANVNAEQLASVLTASANAGTIR